MKWVSWVKYIEIEIQKFVQDVPDTQSTYPMLVLDTVMLLAVNVQERDTNHLPIYASLSKKLCMISFL
jgi:hypothetical protein